MPKEWRKDSVAVCRSVLRDVAVCCSVLKCVVVFCGVIHRDAEREGVMKDVICAASQCIAVRCKAM